MALAAADETIFQSHDYDKGADTLAGKLIPLIVKSASVVYRGAMVNIDTSGFLVPSSDTANEVFAGIATQTITGDGTKTCLVEVSNRVIKRATTGSTIAQGDVGAKMYAQGDDLIADAAFSTNDAVVVGRLVGFTTGFGFVRMHPLQT